MGFVLGNNFTLTINEDMYEVVPPTFGELNAFVIIGDSSVLFLDLIKKISSEQNFYWWLMNENDSLTW